MLLFKPDTCQLDQFISSDRTVQSLYNAMFGVQTNGPCYM